MKNKCSNNNNTELNAKLDPRNVSHGSKSLGRILAPFTRDSGWAVFHPEHESEVIGRHGLYLLESPAVRDSLLLHPIEIPNAPRGILAAKRRIKGGIARAGVDAVTHEWPVDDQDSTHLSPLGGSGKQSARAVGS